MFRQYSRKWQPRAEAWTPHKIVGTAIHSAIACWLVKQIVPSTFQEPPSDATIDPIGVGIQTLSDGYVEQETWAQEGLEALVKKGYTILRTALEDHLLEGAQVSGVEMVDPAPPVPGVRVPRTVDCILERNEGLEVWDWKTHMRLEDQYLGERMRSVLHSWQLLDYSWHVQQWFKKPVTHAGYGLVILAPKARVQFVPVALNPERLQQWRRDAEAIWAEMLLHDTSGSGVTPWHNWEACSDRHLHFGKECVFMPACHELNGNESLFSGVYQLKEE